MNFFGNILRKKVFSEIILTFLVIITYKKGACGLSRTSFCEHNFPILY